ncbi:MAG: hypothetical protein QOE63_1692, partial [Acidimicrobiaceae bacterium]
AALDTSAAQNAAVVTAPSVAVAPASSNAPPAPTTDLGAAQVYTDPAAVEYWQNEINTWPLHVDLGPLGIIGVDPKLTDAVDNLLGGQQK